MDIYKEINKNIFDKDQHIIIAVTKEYIQSFVEANFDRQLTESELHKLSWLVWEEGDDCLLNWIYAAVKTLFEERGQKDKK